MKTFTITWTSQDVIDRAKDNDIDINESTADWVLELLEKYYDCNQGVTWVDLDYYIDQVTEARRQHENA